MIIILIIDITRCSYLCSLLADVSEFELESSVEFSLVEAELTDSGVTDVEEVRSSFRVEVQEGIGELVRSKLEGVVVAFSEALVQVGEDGVHCAAGILALGILACDSGIHVPELIQLVEGV